MALAGWMLSGCADFNCCDSSVIVVDPDPIILKEATGNTANVEVTSSVVWRVVAKPDWVTLPMDGPAGVTNFIITAAANTPGAVRSDKITFQAANGDKTTVQVTQIMLGNFTVTQNLSDVSSTNGTTVIKEDEDFTTTFTPQTGYNLPSTITVTMDGATLTNGHHYDYNSATGVLTVYGVTGDLVITVQGVFILTYDANGGSNPPAAESYIPTANNVTVKDDTGMSAPTGTWDFMGWNTKANGSGIFYEPGTVFPITANTTFYAMWSGDGSSESTAILIKDPAGLDDVHTTATSSLYYRVVNNVDLTGYVSPNMTNTTGWLPIGPASGSTGFTGVFDGNGHIISGLWINRTGTGGDYVGLFGRIAIGGVVKNVGVVIDEKGIKGSGAVGGLTGCVMGSTVSGCWVTGGPVSGTGDDVGGISGHIHGESGGTQNGIIKDSYTTVEVSGRDHIGGIVGNYSSGSVPSYIQRCYATGKISGDNYVGGIAGIYQGPQPCYIEDCVALNAEIVRSFGTSSLFGRVAGTNSGFTFGNNYGWTGMPVAGATVTIPMDKQGADVTIVQAQTESWWKAAAGTGANWSAFWGTTDAAPWQWDATLLRPILYWQ